MVSSELGACEWFVWDIRKSGLIDRGHLDQLIGEFLKRNPRAEPPALAEYLVGQNVLTPFQAERILQSKTQGLVLGPYVLVDAIGAGSMGQVYRATSKTDNRSYAVKVLPRRSMWNVRLARRQVRAFSQFTQAGVVPFVDVGTSGGLHYLVWPLVEGETLEMKVQREGRLSPVNVARIGYHVSQALAVCHQNGIFHGLIKPSNIMLGADGQARLLDFGIGSLLAENEGESLVDTMSTANTLTSGLDCSSPESIMEPTNRTPAGDQYSLGCTLYFALAGHYPFPDGTAVEKMMAHQSKSPTSLRDLVAGMPEAMIAIIERLMQKSPEARYSGVDEVVEALQPLTVEGTQSEPVAPRGKAPVRQAEPLRLTPVPGRGGVPLPPLPKTAAGHAPTIHGNPVAAAPPARVATPMPLPSRQTLQPVAQTPAPVQLETEASANNHSPAFPVRRVEGTAPGWVPETASRGGIGPLLIILVAALVTVGVYLLGKNFMFPNP
jgi:tRNA A-37 threonylcarbamoyl transferase component Bud32